MCVTAFWPKLPRHSLIWLAEPPPDPAARAWWKASRPFILCRTRPQEALSLGFSLIVPQARPTREALGAKPQQVGMISRPPTLDEAACRLPILAPLLPLQQELKLKVRLFGSALWQSLTGEPYLRPDSDLDFLIEVSSRAELTAAINFFQAAETLLPHRIDGEISLPGLGEVAWREWASATPTLLVKSLSDVQLIDREKISCALPPVAPTRAEKLAADAVASLLDELALYPKPGLVSPQDSGAHADMDFTLMKKSAHTLLPFLIKLAQAGGSFEEWLVPLGQQAESAMLAATRGVNTHRGAIFVLGLLLSTLGSLPANSAPATVQATFLQRFGAALKNHANRAPHPDRPGGARQEAAEGFPAIFSLALPHLRLLLSDGVPHAPAALETLFQLIATVSDTTVFHRRGHQGLREVQSLAQQFLDAGGVRTPDWFERALTIHHHCTQANLSPGGCADLLAATLFLHRQTTI